MYIFKGKKLTKEQAEKIAAETDRDLTTFLNDNPEIEEDPDFGPQEESGKTSIIADQNAPAMIGSTALQLEDGSSELPESKYNTPLTRDERIALQNNKFMRQMSKENNITKERLDELTEINADPVIEEVLSIDLSEPEAQNKTYKQAAIDYFNLEEVTAPKTKNLTTRNGITKQRVAVTEKEIIARIEKDAAKKGLKGEEITSYVNSYINYKEAVDQYDINVKNSNGKEIVNFPKPEDYATTGAIKSTILEKRDEAETSQRERLAEQAFDEAGLSKDETARAKVIFNQRVEKEIELKKSTEQFLDSSLKSIVSKDDDYVIRKKKLNEDIDSYLAPINSIDNKLDSLQEQTDGFSEGNYTLDQATEYNKLVDERNAIVNSGESTKLINAEVGLNSEYNDIIKLVDERDSKLESYIGKENLYKNIDSAGKAILKDYSFSTRAAFAMEGAFAGAGSMVGAYALKGISYVGVGLAMAKNPTFLAGSPSLELINKKILNNAFVKLAQTGVTMAVNYNEGIDERSKILPQSVTVDEVRSGSSSVGSFLMDAVANATPTLATIALPVGGARLLSMGGLRAGMSYSALKTAAASNQKLFSAATNLSSYLMGMQTGGEQISSVEIVKKGASLKIQKLKEEIEKTKDPIKVSELNTQIASLENALNTSQLKIGLAGLTTGLVTRYSEKLVTLALVNKSRNYFKALDENSIIKLGKLPSFDFLRKTVNAEKRAALLEIGKQGVIAEIKEQGQEVAEQLSQNIISKNLILGQNVNIFEGIDEDLFANTFIASRLMLANKNISNISNVIKENITSKQELDGYQKLTREILLAQDLPTAERLKETKRILAKLGLNEVVNLNKINYLAKNGTLNQVGQIEAALNVIKKKAQKLSDTVEGTPSAEIKSQLKDLEKEFENLQNSKEDLLLVQTRKNTNLVKALEKSAALTGQKLISSPTTIFHLNLFEASNTLAEGMKGDNELIFIEHDENGDKDFSSIEQFKGVMTEVDGVEVDLYESIVDGDANAYNYEGIAIVDLFNSKKSIVASTVDSDGEFAAVSALHELSHIRNKNDKIDFSKETDAGLQNRQAIDDAIQTLKNKKEQGESVEEIDKILKRLETYPDDYEEFMQVFVDAFNLGLIRKSDFENNKALTYSFSSLFSNIIEKGFGQSITTVVQFNSGSDVFNYVESFRKNAVKGVVLPGIDEDEKKTGKLNLSEKADLEVSADNLIRSSINEENTAIVLNPESTPAQIDKAKTALVENNQGIINNVINKNFKQGLDTDLTREEFAADIGLEVQKLINTYGKNKKTGKTAPFGIYLRDNLPLRVPAIFNTQLQTVDGDIIKKVDISKADQAIDENSNDNNDVDLSKKINATKFGPVKDKVKAISDIVNIEKDAKKTYKELTNEFLDAVSKEVFDISGKRISGKVTLTSPEAKKLQRLFVNADNVKKLIKTMPPYNVASSDTTIDEQGENIDVSRDVKGRAIGLSPKFIDKYYIPVTRAIPGISNAKGRSLGETSQPPVKELKPEYKGIISNKTIKQIQNDVGVTEAGIPNVEIKEADRSRYGTTLTGFARTYLANAINTVGRSKIDSKQGKADLGAGKSKLMFSKAFPEKTNLELNLAVELTELIEKSDIDTFYDGNGSILPEYKKYSNVADIVYELFNEPGGLDTSEGKKFKKSVKDSKDIPSDIKDRFLDQGTFRYNKDAKDVLASDVKIISKALGSDIMDILGYDVFGFYNRALDPASRKINPKWKKGDSISEKYLQGVSGEYFEALQDIKKAVSGSKSKVQSKVLKDVRKMNKSFPLFKKVDKIFKLDISREAKIKELEKLKLEIEAANKANIELANFIVKDVNKLYRDGKIDGVTVLNILQLQTNATGGLRALSTLDFVTFEDGPQLYNTKGEHLAPNANTMFELAEIILDKKLNTEDSNSLIEGAFAEHSQWYTSNELTDIVDKRGGKNNRSNSGRIKFLDNKDIVNVFNIDGSSYRSGEIIKEFENKVAPVNNKKLPSVFKFSKSTDYTNNMVLDVMSELDDNNQTEELKFSKALDLNKDFNDIIENKTGIASDKTYARVKAEVAGANKGKFNFFIPPSAEDFVGLLYSTLGKGSTGDAQMAWYKAHLLNPFARAMENLANDRANMMQDFRGLKKALKIVPKNLRKKIKDSDFTQEQAVRAYIWDKQGMEIPGLSQKDQQALVDFVNEDANLTTFADQLIAINKGDAYAAPDAGWVAGSIDTDFIKALNTTKRSKYLEVWQQNADQIFSEANLNKLEAAYGANYREAMVDMLKRMSTGKNTSSGSDRLAARFTDWLTNSVGAIMFFNTRSAVLQTISAVNFINFSDNNVLKAGAAFANQPQYWSDFKKLFNSPFLLDRRSGLKLNVNEADIAAMAKGPGNNARNVIAGILKAGFLPTQLADSFAIASGGASFYRNRIKALQKEGLTEAEAEEQAFRDFREIAEESQQSSRPDKISQQQAGPLGRVVLAFANTPAQYARLIKKAASDLKNGRGDAKTNISKIIYYGVAQNLLFSALQQALFAIAFDDDEEEEKKNEKYFNIVNGMSDSILRGIGIGGAIVSVVKNTALRLAKEADKKSPKYQDAVVKGILQISPPISSKIGKLQSAGRSYSWNQEEMRTRGWSIDNPAYLANANVISALTNVPLDRAVKKITNIVDAGNEDIEYYKRVALALGWSAWELGIDKKGGKVAPPKTDMDKLYDLTKKQQIDSLTNLGISRKQIKLLKLEEDRVNAILNPKSIKQIKVSKKDSLFGLNKKDQIQALEKLGLTKKEIRALRLESDRVEAIINKQKKEVE